MYNGVGLPTPRGSGTSGYIQRNLGALPPRRSDLKPPGSAAPVKRSPFATAGGDEELLEHERKRRIEVKLLDMREEWETQGIEGDELEEKIDKERERLLKTETLKIGKDTMETHLQARAKQEEDRKLRAAFGIDVVRRPAKRQGREYDSGDDEEVSPRVRPQESRKDTRTRSFGTVTRRSRSPPNRGDTSDDDSLRAGRRESFRRNPPFPTKGAENEAGEFVGPLRQKQQPVSEVHAEGPPKRNERVSRGRGDDNEDATVVEKPYRESEGFRENENEDDLEEGEAKEDPAEAAGDSDQRAAASSLRQKRPRSNTDDGEEEEPWWKVARRQLDRKRNMERRRDRQERDRSSRGPDRRGRVEESRRGDGHKVDRDSRYDKPAPSGDAVLIVSEDDEERVQANAGGIRRTRRR